MENWNSKVSQWSWLWPAMFEKAFLPSSHIESVDGKAEAFRLYSYRQKQWSLHIHCAGLVLILMLSWSDTDSYYIALTMLPHVLNLFYLHRDVFFLAGFLGGEDIRDFFVRSGLAADGTLNGASVRPHAVLFNNNWNALITETVSTGQYCPLKEKTHNIPQWGANKDAF